MLHRFKNDVLDLAPTDVVSQAGINDLIAGAALGDGDRARRAALNNLTTMAGCATAAGIRVHLQTVVRPARAPLWRLPVWSKLIYDQVTALNADLYRLSCAQVNVMDAVYLVAGNSKMLPGGRARDTRHFNTAAYLLLNQQLDNGLRSTPDAVQ